MMEDIKDIHDEVNELERDINEGKHRLFHQPNVAGLMSVIFGKAPPLFIFKIIGPQNFPNPMIKGK